MSQFSSVFCPRQIHHIYELARYLLAWREELLAGQAELRAERAAYPAISEIYSKNLLQGDFSKTV